MNGEMSLPAMGAPRGVGDGSRGDYLNSAYRHADEAMDVAGPRGMVFANADALTARARVPYAYTAADPARRAAYVGRVRDDAYAALRLATRHGLAWKELDALQVHAYLDQLVPADASGLAGKAHALGRRLIPTDLNPEPLTTIEREAADRSEEESQADDRS
jgi:hypothetical protein